MKESDVMIVGLGGVGYETTRILSRLPYVNKITTADIDEKKGKLRSNSIEMEANSLNQQTNVEFVQLDVFDQKETVKTINEVNPNVIFSAATLVDWWVDKIPDEVQQKLTESTSEGPGAATLIPGQIPLVYNLVEAVKKSNITRPTVVNASIPDIVCPVIHRCGYEKIIGIGNVGLQVPPLKKVVSDELGHPMHDICVYLVATHALVNNVLQEGNAGGVPYFLKIIANGNDVTDEIDPNNQLLRHSLPFPDLPKGPERDPLVAANAAHIIGNVLNPTGKIVHAPGPQGNIGGYPVRINDDSIDVVLPNEIDKEEALKINHRGIKFDGVAEIEDDGTIQFTDKTSDVFNEVLGVDVQRVKPSNAGSIAERLELAIEKL